MSIERQQRVFELLDEALDQPPEQRARFLDQASRDDSWVRLEVEALLETETSSGLLDEPAFSVHAEDSGIGRRIGDYTLTELLERGGMGAVYLAEREHFEQQVAVKVIRRGLDLDQVSVRRFHNERQILARLTHPNIARLLDGGTTEDQLPYFVMEYVEGEPITRHCRQEHLSIEARLKLFRKVCSAVQFAHRNLVVHRDLKPGNILVTAEGEPKLLDFGIAKLLDQSLAVHPLATSTGEGPMTARYASPEQIRLEPITTASDVYSLGVLLYELLTGLDPYHVDSGQRIEMARAICEDEPDKPSTAVRRRADECTTNGRAPSTDPASIANRETDPKKLRRRLSGDLDSIVLKAMRKEPDLRYSSVEQLSEDIGRHLEGLPVVARSGASFYRASKFVRRNRFAFAATIVFVLSGLSLGIIWQEAAEEKEQSERQRDIAVKRSDDSNRAQELMSEFVAELLNAYIQHPDAPGSREEAVRRLVDDAIQEIETRQLDPEDQIQIAGGIGEVLRELTLPEEAEVFMQISLDRALKHYENREHPEIALRLSNIGALLFDQKSYAESEEYFRLALNMRTRLGQPEVEFSRTKNNLASALKLQNRPKEALFIYLEVLAARQDAYRSITGLSDQDVASSHWLVGATYYALGQFGKAADHASEALVGRRLAPSPSSKNIARAAHLLGQVQAARGQRIEAEQLYREALKHKRDHNKGDSGGIAKIKKDLAELLIQDNLQSAHQLIEEALARLSAEDTESIATAEAQNILGAVLTASGKYAEAEPYLVQSTQKIQTERGEGSWRTKQALQRVIDLYDAWGKPEERDTYLERMRESTS